jgi:hypothetical protein
MSAPETGGRRALTLAIMALVFSLILPAAGLALSAFATVIAARDLRALNRAQRKIGMVTSAIVISVIAFVLGAASTTVQLYFSSELSAYTECTKGAGTVEARQECSDQLKQAISDKLGVPWPANVPLPA